MVETKEVSIAPLVKIFSGEGTNGGFSVRSNFANLDRHVTGRYVVNVCQKIGQD